MEQKYFLHATKLATWQITQEGPSLLSQKGK